jgi:hypothetical protein
LSTKYCIKKEKTMSLFDLGGDLSSTISTAQNAITSAAGLVDTVGNLGSALSSAYDSGGVMSAIRSINIPAGAEAVGDILGAVASFGGDENADDWRVRLSLANWSSFKSSPVMAPLKQAGGLIFPYTPTITIASGARYGTQSVVHNNYMFQYYQNSDPGTIQIQAPMYVEDSTQGLYWIAMVHYLRSLTKMFTGSDPKAGNPPPIVHLNGYGHYVFKNVPVVVTKMSVQLDASSDYIGCHVAGSMASEISAISDQMGGLFDTIGGAVNGLSGITGALSSVAGTVGQVSGVLGTFGVGGTDSGTAHVPTKSSIEVTLQPIYSRDSVRKFSLDKFVTGGYMNSSVGYI